MVHRFVSWNLNLNYNKSSLSKEERKHYNTLKHCSVYIFSHCNLSIADSLSQNKSVNLYKILPGIPRSELALDDQFPCFVRRF